MGAQINSVSNLSTYVANSAAMADLKAKIKQLDNKLNTIDANLKLCEMLDCPYTADRLAQQYNEVNVKRVLLNLKLNKLERETLLFELNSNFRD